MLEVTGKCILSEFGAGNLGNHCQLPWGSMIWSIIFKWSTNKQIFWKRKFSHVFSGSHCGNSARNICVVNNMFHYLYLFMIYYDGSLKNAHHLDSFQVTNMMMQDRCFGTFPIHNSNRNSYSVLTVYFDSNSTQVCSAKSDWQLIGDILERIGDKPLPEAMLTQLTDMYPQSNIRHMVHYMASTAKPLI